MSPVFNGQWLVPIVSHGLAVELVLPLPYMDHWMRRANRGDG